MTTVEGCGYPNEGWMWGVRPLFNTKIGVHFLRPLSCQVLLCLKARQALENFGASFEIDSLFENALMTCHFDRKIVLVSAVWLPWLKPEPVGSWLTFTLSSDVAGIRQHVMTTIACEHHFRRLCGLAIESNVTLLGPSTFANFRCNSESKKRFSLSARYAWELPEKIVDRGVYVCEELFIIFLRYHSPSRAPVRFVISVWSAGCQYRASGKATES